MVLLLRGSVGHWFMLRHARAAPERAAPPRSFPRHSQQKHVSAKQMLLGLQDGAEFAKIGKYYAVESMLVWDPVAQVR